MTADLLPDSQLANLRIFAGSRDTEPVTATWGYVRDLLDHEAALRADRDTLLDALAKYGRHVPAKCRWAHPPVIWQGGMSAKPPCTCGFDAVLARVRSHTGKDPA